MKCHKFSQCLLLSTAAGLLTSLSFSCAPLWPLCFFSLIPLYFAVSLGTALSYKKNILIYVTFGLSFYGTDIIWLMHLAEVISDAMSKPLAVALLILGIIVVSVLIGLFFALGMIMLKRLFHNKLCDVVVFSFLYILAEYFQQIFTPVSFPWARLCTIVTPFTAFIQSASLFGGLFVSLIIAAINGFFAFALIELKSFGSMKETEAKSKSIKRALLSLFCAIMAFAANTVFGAVRLSHRPEEKSKQNAVIVQGNYSGLDKWSAETDEIMDAYINLAEEQIDENTKLVVFPETAVPFYYYSDELGSRFRELASKNNIVLVTGIRYIEYDDEGVLRHYNSMICINPDGSDSGVYSKRILVPLGEYMPFADFFSERFPWVFNIVGYYSIGTQSGALRSDNGIVGGVICYESIYPDIAGSAVDDGAEILAVISNDSWFGESAALRQHHAHAILRAVENNRYVLRASSTAISSIINNYGEVEESAPMLEAYALKGSYELENNRTLYSLTSDIIIIPSALIALAGVILALSDFRCKRTSDKKSCTEEK